MDAKIIELPSDETTVFCACAYPNYRQYMSPHNFKTMIACIKSYSRVINYSASILVFVKQSFLGGLFLAFR